jgi:hypothetical protein
MSYLRQGAFLPGNTENIVTSGTSQAANVVGATTSIVRITTTENIYVAIGADPTATTDDMLIVGGGVEYLAVVPGTSKVAVLQQSSSGIASITELSPLPD